MRRFARKQISRESDTGNGLHVPLLSVKTEPYASYNPLSRPFPQWAPTDSQLRSPFRDELKQEDTTRECGIKKEADCLATEHPGSEDSGDTSADEPHNGNDGLLVEVYRLLQAPLPALPCYRALIQIIVQKCWRKQGSASIEYSFAVLRDVSSQVQFCATLTIVASEPTFTVADKWNRSFTGQPQRRKSLAKESAATEATKYIVAQLNEIRQLSEPRGLSFEDILRQQATITSVSRVTSSPTTFTQPYLPAKSRLYEFLQKTYRPTTNHLPLVKPVIHRTAGADRRPRFRCTYMFSPVVTVTSAEVVQKKPLEVTGPWTASRREAENLAATAALSAFQRGT